MSELQRVEQKIAAFEEARDALATLVRVKQRQLATVEHELNELKAEAEKLRNGRLL